MQRQPRKKRPGGDGSGPVEERRFFHEGHATDMDDDPITGLQDVVYPAEDVRLILFPGIVASEPREDVGANDRDNDPNRERRAIHRVAGGMPNQSGHGTVVGTQLPSGIEVALHDRAYHRGLQREDLAPSTTRPKVLVLPSARSAPADWDSPGMKAMLCSAIIGLASGAAPQLVRSTSAVSTHTAKISAKSASIDGPGDFMARCKIKTAPPPLRDTTASTTALRIRLSLHARGREPHVRRTAPSRASTRFAFGRRSGTRSTMHLQSFANL